jgi:hypothetical protein
MPPTFPSLTQPVMSGPHPDLAPLPSNTAVVPLPSWHVPTYPPIRYSGWQLQVRVSQPASCKSCWVLGPTVATTNCRQRARARAFTSRLRSWFRGGHLAGTYIRFLQWSVMSLRYDEMLLCFAAYRPTHPQDLDHASSMRRHWSTATAVNCRTRAATAGPELRRRG